MAMLELTETQSRAPCTVSVDQYRQFREQGFLVVRGLLSPDDLGEMNDYMDDMLAGRRNIEGALIMKDFGQKPNGPADWTRAHMLHLLAPIFERYLLLPRVLDVLA